MSVCYNMYKTISKVNKKRNIVLRWKRTDDSRFWWAGTVYRHFLFLNSQTLHVLSPLPVARWYLRTRHNRSETSVFSPVISCVFNMLSCDWLTRWGRSAGCRSPSGVLPGKQRSVPSEGPTPDQTHPALWVDETRGQGHTERQANDWSTARGQGQREIIEYVNLFD